MSEDHQHTQVGIVTIIVILLSAACTAFALISALQSAEGQTATLLIITSLVVTGVFILVLVAFNSFTIQVAHDTVTFWFGCGFARQSLPKEAIRSVEIVRNPWHYF